MRVNKKGQATIEAALLMPPLVFGIAVFLLCLYIAMVVSWSDYWIYRSNMCMVANTPPRLCERLLNEKLSILLPKQYFEIDELWITRRQSKIKLHIRFGDYFHRRFTSEVSLPLKVGL